VPLPRLLRNLASARPDHPGRRRTTRLRGLALAAAASVAALPLLSTPAAAHNYLVSASPAENASLQEAPAAVELEFNEVVRRTGSGVVVTGPDGQRWDTADAQIIGGTVTQALKPLGPAGDYEVAYRIVSADGHPVTGRLTFTLTQEGAGGAAPEPTAAPPTTGAPESGSAVTPVPADTEPATELDSQAASSASAEDGGMAWWLPVGVLVVIAGLVAAFVVTRRQGVPSDDD
jgi:methionine-rich copper-binding protein CopC